MKSLKTLVIVLGVLIVLSMGLLGWGFYTKFTGSDTALVEETAPEDTESGTLDALAEFGEVRIDLPAGCTVVDMRPDGDRLYLIESTSRRDLTRYAVRAYDVGERRLLPHAIVDPEEKDEMSGAEPGVDEKQEK